jgi:hypothetical protein
MFSESSKTALWFSSFAPTLKGAKNRTPLAGELGEAKINYSPPAGGLGQIIDFQA